jgi:cobaltochelatase CobT
MDIIEISNLTGYTPYTDEFDRIEDIEDIVSQGRIAEIHRSLTQFREYEEEQMGAFSQAAAGLVSHLSQKFEENGLDPNQTTVTFLIDGSGSTRGEPGRNMALATIELCVALEKMGVETTVLGYTTSSWKGGDSRKKWLNDGKPANPGRLCDLLHVVYKRPADTVADTLDLLCALACDETKKENIDGEAVMWAAEGMRDLERSNKILVNVTDGFMPIDDSTLVSNARADLLLGHLLTVNNAIEDEGLVALSGVYVNLVKEHLEMMTRLKEQGQNIFQRHAIADGHGDLNATFTAVIDGVELGIRRAAELSPRQLAAAMD